MEVTPNTCCSEIEPLIFSSRNFCVVFCPNCGAALRHVPQCEPDPNRDMEREEVRRVLLAWNRGDRGDLCP